MSNISKETENKIHNEDYPELVELFADRYLTDYDLAVLIDQENYMPKVSYEENENKSPNIDIDISGIKQIINSIELTKHVITKYDTELLLKNLRKNYRNLFLCIKISWQR